MQPSVIEVYFRGKDHPTIRDYRVNVVGLAMARDNLEPLVTWNGEENAAFAT